MYRVTVVLFATIISTSFAQEVFDGSCPKVRVVQPFIAARFAGSWYEWGRYSSQTELETKCNVFEFVFHDDAKNLEVYYSGLTDDDSEISMKGSAILTKPAGQFNLTIPEIGINNLSYFILGTDYRNWVAFFACRDLDGNQHQRYVWFMTRSVCPTAADILSARNAIIGQGISVESLEPVDQQHC